jgi:hypothetical protein
MPLMGGEDAAARGTTGAKRDRGSLDRGERRGGGHRDDLFRFLSSVVRAFGATVRSGGGEERCDESTRDVETNRPWGTSRQTKRREKCAV